ncbi:MAG: DNA polymerase II small subunit [Patescibacteria group bacterium]|jgi:DNA polymerase II small subunit
MANELLRECMKKGFLLDREMLAMFTSLDSQRAYAIIDILANLQLGERVVTKKVFSLHLDKIQKALMRFSGGDEVTNFFSTIGGESTGTIIQPSAEVVVPNTGDGSLTILRSVGYSPKKVTVNDFITHFQHRYGVLQNILEKKGFDDLTSIRKIIGSRGNYTIIATILEKRVTKNKNLMFTVEDLTGKIDIVCNKSNSSLFEQAMSVMLDDVVAFRVQSSQNLLFANEIVFAGIESFPKKYSDTDSWVAFTSDLHCGSSLFMEEHFLRFIKWINGEGGDVKYREIARRVKYLFIAGDLVDSVNQYPGHEKELSLFSLQDQYKKVEELLRLIRSDIQIIICPGTRDAVWIGEPQPAISSEWASGLAEMKNVTLVSNPSLVELDAGYRILMYHGSSINAFIDELSTIRQQYGHSAPTVLVREMLRRRHLAPMHGMVDYIPGEIDSLVITEIPDIVVTGNQHCVDISSMENILLIGTGCWQEPTSYMDKTGLSADTARVPLFNLKSRELKILDFNSDLSKPFWNESPDLLCKITEVNSVEGDDVYVK